MIVLALVNKMLAQVKEDPASVLALYNDVRRNICLLYTSCAFEADGCLVIMLPGPPLECEPLLRYRVRPFLAARGDGIILSLIHI